MTLTQSAAYAIPGLKNSVNPIIGDGFLKIVGYDHKLRNTPENIIKIVCAHFEIKLEDIKSPEGASFSEKKIRAVQKYVIPRYIIMWLLKRLTALRDEEITKIFNLNRTMTYTAVRTINNLIETKTEDGEIAMKLLKTFK